MLQPLTRATLPDQAVLEAIVAEMRQRLAAEQPIGDQDEAFHEALRQAVHNPTFGYVKRLVQDAIGVSALGHTLAQARPADQRTPPQPPWPRLSDRAGDFDSGSLCGAGSRGGRKERHHHGVDLWRADPPLT